MPGKLKLDLSDVPEQAPILKNESDRLYADNTRKRKTRPDASRYMGVYKESSMNKWKAQIMVDGKVCSLGYYSDEEQAARIYAKAAYKYKRPRQDGLYGGLDLSGVPDQPLIVKDNVKTAIGKNSSKFKGVKKCKKRWQARVTIQGKPTTLGTFDTEEEAAAIYAKAAYFLQQQNCSDAKERDEGCASKDTVHNQQDDCKV